LQRVALLAVAQVLDADDNAVQFIASVLSESAGLESAEK